MGTQRKTVAAMITASLLLASPDARAQDLSFLDVPARPRPARERPTPGMQRGLRELEGELTRFGARVQGYRRSVDALLQRRARAERRRVLSRYSMAIRDEQRLSGRARDRAIAALESFVTRHPDEPRYTPGALLRLADLYLERALLTDGTPDLSDPIRVTRRILLAYPDDRAVDRAAYLLGWALAETGEVTEAQRVWRAFVCANRFSYPEASEPAPMAHEAYEGCRSARESSLAPEIWLRLGEQHFDDAELDRAIAAYRRVVAHPEDRLYSFGLYKLAWSHYRAAHYPEAIERFAALLRYSDEARQRTGAAGSDLREEALQYLALTLAYDDWNEDGRADHTQGDPHPLERLEDPTLWPHDAPFAAEVYRRVGDVLFEMGHPDEAIVAWRMRLARYGQGCDAPEVSLAIVRAQRQIGDEDAALATLDGLARRMARSSWGSVSCPGNARRAEALLERALRSTAHLHHAHAQALRRRALVDGDDALRARANASYARAVSVYEQLLASFPNDPDAYEIAYDRADALYWSGRYPEAAQAYADVRDSPYDDRLFARAARRVVEALTRVEEASGVSAPEEPHLVDGRPVASPVPTALQAAARAREIYVRWVRPEEDAERVRDAYAFNNARLLFLFGHWGPASERFEALFEEHCAGPRASDVGRDAWRALERMARQREDLSGLDALTGALRARACTFRPSGAPVLSGACETEGSLACDVPQLEHDVRFRRLRDEALALRHLAPARRARRAQGIATRLVQTVDRAPDHDDAPAALLLAARLLDQEARRPRSAAALYQRIVDEVPPRTTEREGIVAEAHFQLARAAQRSFEYERALRAYATIVESDRFARSTDPTMAQRRRDALVNAALLTARLGRHASAARLFARAADELGEVEARQARLRAAEQLLEAGQAAEARDALRRWLRGGPSVRAAWLLARAAEAIGDEDARRGALTRTVEAFDREAPTARADRALAARAALALARDAQDEQGSGPIAPGRRATMSAFVQALRAEVEQRGEAAQRTADAFERAIALRHPESSVTALERQGAVYEGLARATLDARFETPSDVTRSLRRASVDVRRQARERLEDALRATLDELVRPLECRAIERYALSARLATRASLPSLSAQRATERLGAYGEERVRACLARAHARDPSFDPYRPGELERARAGLHPPLVDGIAPGPLAPD